MNKRNISATVLMFSLIVFAAFIITVNEVSAATSPPLGAAGSYSALAGSIVTNTGPSIIPGDLGVSPSIGVPPHVTGFPPGIVGPPGAIHDADLQAAAAQAANTAAFGALSAGANAACTTNYGAITQDLSGLTLVPGVYCADAFALSGTLTLDDTGNAAGVWIFRSELSTLTTTPGVGAKVQFLNGLASTCNVWWKVSSSATIGSGTAFIGNILALTSISLGTGANLNGRALAQTGAVTLDTNQITRCGDTPSLLSNITLVPASANLSVGNTLQLNATCLNQFGALIAGNISYNSSNPFFASVNASGFVTAVTSGGVTITAICEAAGRVVSAISKINGGAPGHKQIPIMDDKLFMLLTVSTLVLGLYGLKKYGR